MKGKQIVSLVCLSVLGELTDRSMQNYAERKDTSLNWYTGIYWKSLLIFDKYLCV